MAQHISADAPLEADANVDSDSAVDASSIGYSSDLTSITSSILNYEMDVDTIPTEQPNDDDEQDRMDLLHHVYGLLLQGQLHYAPIPESPQRVLDLGTGTGIWASDFADQYPSAQVIGNDLSPIQQKWTPPNCSFEIDDFEEEWTFSQPFDYIHGRELAGSVKDFDRLFAQAYKHLKPGGHLEMQSFRVELFSDDGTLQNAPYTNEWISLLHDASLKFGKIMTNMDEWPEKMAKAGFEDIQLRVVKVPMNPWPEDRKQKEIGLYMRCEQEQAAAGYTTALLSRVLGWSKQEIDVLLGHVISELRDTSIHQYSKMYLVYGRKPGKSVAE
ncbi:conserved hypothetical protein [Paecilomyces variotii No. 5]|uniref:S-adenosyl-L-methionine-dependent methyltransferase n=1 Tax=Byssochlamys spectabilis (strain No. 5 / NBRC 109023) TaxID=1356009 RepID=V5I4M0_BYSSN|nr:conserved hypothetical protein [Paecilomyces variotii No. 5]